MITRAGASPHADIFVGSVTSDAGRRQGEFAEFRYRLRSHLKIHSVLFQTDALVPDCVCSGQCRSQSCEWIQDDALSQRQYGTHEMSKKLLWLERRMWRNPTLRSRRWTRPNHIAEWLAVAGPSKTSCLPLPQIVLHAPFQGFSQHDPRLPHRSWHHAYAVEFLVSVFRPIAAAHRHRQTRDVPANFQPTLSHRRCHDVR